MQKRLTLALVSALALAACSKDSSKDQKRPTPTVGYVVVQPSSVARPTELGGRIVAFQSSEVRPQVNGLIRARRFVEGGFVRKGQPLFQIDPSLYQASTAQAAANLASARASAEAAQVKANRYRPLAAMEAISKQDYTDAAAAARQARASVAQNAAALRTAQINLRFTTIPAPINGRIGRSLFTVGALVTANQTDPLAVITSVDPVYVDMQESAADLTALKKSLMVGGVAPGSTQVHLKMDDGSIYGFAGTVQFSEMVVNQATGTVTLRARFPNPQGLLLPGSFVTATFDQAVDTGVYLVPQQAVLRDMGGAAYVMVVGADGKAMRRNVNATRTYQQSWVIDGGLKPGDKVITQGLNNLKPNTPVKAVPASAPQKVAPPSPEQMKAAKKSGARGSGG
ncbi:efflux RND transporter periplasmic adaptor subunit [Sphingomonas sp. ASV193]|uniref:efflux RND transporter periplasmic adaptor subunit n=1 Tax=Sphingomonas sp. ASV193 TaxID=3144405 RepID=UPI0032E901FC